MARRLQRDHRPLLITAIAALSCVGTSLLASRCVERPAQLLTASPSAEVVAASDERCAVALLAPHTPSREPVVLDEPVWRDDPALELRTRQARILLERLAEQRDRDEVSGVVWSFHEAPAKLSAGELTLTLVDGERFHFRRPEGFVAEPSTRADAGVPTLQFQVWNQDGLELVPDECDGETVLRFRIDTPRSAWRQR